MTGWWFQKYSNTHDYERLMWGFKVRFFRVIVYRRVLAISPCHFNPRIHSWRGQNVTTTIANQQQQKKVKEHTNLIYLEITRLYTPLFFRKSTLLRCVTSAFRISSCCYIRICFSLIFLLTWRICFHSGPLRMIFVVTTFFHLVRGTQREYSTKPLKHSIVEGIWVFKR